MDLLRRAFRDITAGSTRGVILSRTCYVKHLGFADQIGLDQRREDFFAEAKAAGLLTDEEKLTQLRKHGLWTDAMDTAIKAARQMVIDLTEAKRKNANMPSLVKAYVKRIEEAEKEHDEKLLAKRRLLELTCEVFAERCSNDHYIVANLYEDPAMTVPLYSDDEFDWFRDEMVSQIVADYNAAIEGCNEGNLKRLAMQPFFQRYFQLVGEDMTSLFGKPIAAMTHYQVDLLRWGAHFRHIYQTHDVAAWDPKVLADPDLLSDMASAVTKGKAEMADKGANQEGTTVVGMKTEDRKALGVSSSMDAMNQMKALARR